MLGYIYGQWIKCSENPPGPEKRVLIYDPYDEKIGLGYLGFKKKNKSSVYWMPLPEPPGSEE